MKTKKAKIKTLKGHKYVRVETSIGDQVCVVEWCYIGPRVLSMAWLQQEFRALTAPQANEAPWDAHGLQTDQTA